MKKETGVENVDGESTWRLRVSHLDGEAEDLDAHAAHVRCGHLSHQSGEFVSVLVNLLYSQRA